jgi:hypothetical protein
MPRSTPDVQPLAWRLNRDLPDFLRYVPVLRMPAPFKNGLRGFGDLPGRVKPVTSLYNALASFAPEILAFAPTRQLITSTEPNPHWLYVYPGHDIDLRKLQTLISVWLREWFRSAEAQRLSDQWFKLPSWSWDQIDLNTAPYELRRRLLPALIARHLVSSGFKLPMNNGQGSVLKLDVLLAPLMDEQLMAQLITRRQTYLGDSYAFVLNLWLGVLPPDNTEVLMQRVVVRRWVSRSLVNGDFCKLRWGQSSNVYWQRSTGYLSNSPPVEEVYTRLALKQVAPGAKNIIWLGRQASVLSALNLGESLPEAADLVHDPVAFQPHLLIPQTQQMSVKHRVGMGVWSNDHREVFATVTPLIAAAATPIETASRTQPAWRKSKITPLKAVPQMVRYNALCALPRPIRVELYLDDTDVAKSILLEEVGLEDHFPPEQLYANPLRISKDDRLLLEIVHGETRIAAPLPTNTKSEFRHSTEARKREITRLLHVPPYETGALICLPKYHRMKGQKWRDPKQAIREGLLNSGRTSDFYAPDATAYETRLRSKIRNLLRTLGFRFKPLYQKVEDSGLPEKLDIVALWIIQLNALGNSEQKVMLPMVVHVAHDEGVNLLLPGSTNSPIRYASLQQGILAAERSSRDFRDDQRQGIVRFFRRALEECNRGQDMLLLFWEPNTRRVFDSDDLTRILFPDGVRRTRIARLRFSQYNTAPMCVPRSPYSKYPGLYQANATVFYSLHNVGNRPIVKQAHKYVRLHNPAINPATCLIYLTDLQPEDQAHEWAWLVHDLRLASSHTNTATQLPQPLHDLRLISKYLSRYADEEEDTDIVVQ